MPFPIRRFITLAAFLVLAAITTAQTAVPVVPQVADQDSTEAFLQHDEPVQLHLTATNSPTRFDAMGLPSGVNFTNETFYGKIEGVFSWTLGALTGGVYMVSVTASNAAGTSAPMTFRWTVHPGMVNFIQADKYEYHPGDTITFTAPFSAPVVVTGAPYLPLWADRKAFYRSGSGTRTLTFAYQVANDDPHVAGYSVEDIAAGDGSIKTTDGVPASLHDTYQGLSPQPGFKITDPAPAPEAVDKIYVTRTDYTKVRVNLFFTGNVTVAGSPLLHLTIGGVARTATLTASSSNSVVAVYVPQPGDNGVVALQSPIDLNGGAITSANGLAANLNFNLPDTSQVVVDTVAPAAPVITSFTASGKPTFVGTAEPDTLINVATATAVAQSGAQAAADGTFSTHWSEPGLPPGPYTFYFTATDQANNTSARSQPVTITVSYPAKPATPVITGMDASGTVSGTATPGDWIYLFAGGQLFDSGGSVTAANGTWSIRPVFHSVNDPTHTVTAVAYDTAQDASDRSAPFFLGTPNGGGTTPQTITFSSPTGAVRVGQPITLGAQSSAGLPITYSVVSGDATIAGNVLTPQSTATLIVRASSAGDATYAAASADANFGNPIPVGNSRLVNISCRISVSANDADGATIAGFVIGGSEPTQILIRAVGPSLSQFGITNPLADPVLTLYNNQQTAIATNNGWNDDAPIAAAANAVATFGLNAGSKDAALLMTLSPGLYTARVQSANSGTVLIEVYDVAGNAAVPTDPLVNISTRGHVGSGQDALIGGFVVGGDAPKTVLVRAVGPALRQFNVSGVLSDPMLTIYDANRNVIAQNDDWETPEPLNASPAPANAAGISGAATATGAFPLPAGGKDAAVMLTLSPGGYTAIVTGANGGTGAALVEMYEVR